MKEGIIIGVGVVVMAGLLFVNGYLSAQANQEAGRREAQKHCVETVCGDVVGEDYLECYACVSQCNNGLTSQ